MYHAYPAVGTVYLSRESLLDRIAWDASGWPAVNKGKGRSGNPSGLAEQERTMFVDPFTKQLDPGWRWPIGNEPAYVVGYGSLRVDAAADGAPVFLAHSLTTPAFVSTVRLDPSSAAGGLGVLGGVHTKLVLSRDGVHLALVREAEAKTTELWSATVDAAASVWLRVAATANASVVLSYSKDGIVWVPITQTVSIAHFPPWDQGLRISLVVNGEPGTEAIFGHFNLSADAK